MLRAMFPDLPDWPESPRTALLAFSSAQKAGGTAMKPVASIAVREAIEQVQPLLSLHRHIHESRGVRRIGHIFRRTKCVQPGLRPGHDSGLEIRLTEATAHPLGPPTSDQR